MIGATSPIDWGRTAGSSLNSVSIPTTFSIQEVDGLTSEKPIADVPSSILSSVPSSVGESSIPGWDDPNDNQILPGELNILEKLVGAFKGNGLNMIFRPTFGASATRITVLEYNVTQEEMTFLKDLGNVPNRGFGEQKDVYVRVVPYTQIVRDMLNKDTGKADRPKPVDIHFEQGLFIRSPPTDKRPVIDQGTISRLASIPHGTTINCQGFEPDMKKPIPGKPDIKAVSIIPFPRKNPEDLKTFATFFPQTKFEKSNNLRIPKEIKADGALNPTSMVNPNLVLLETNLNSTKKTIKEHIFFTVASDSKASKIPGGGTANIGFLFGPGVGAEGQNTGPNAESVRVTCDYWISTVVYDVLLPAGDFSGAKSKLEDIPSEAAKEEKAAGKPVVSPTFRVHLTKQIPANTIVKFEATQIQYSQNVVLDFGDIGWPHISVATLSPADPVPIEADKVVF